MAEQNQIENVVIIGGGPAGLSAALYNARAGLKPVVFAGSPPGGQLTLTTEVENFPGQEGVMGPELVEKIRNQAKKFGTTFIDENIARIDFSKKPFTLFYSEDKKISAKTVIIATGAQALWLGLESEQRLRGRGVSACATCDGFFFRNKIVAVVGGGDSAMEEAVVLTKFAQKVYLIHRRDSFRASQIMQERVFTNPKIEVIFNAAIDEILGEQKVSGVKLSPTNQTAVKNSESSPRIEMLSESKTLTLDGVFVAIGHRPDTDIFKDAVHLDSKGYIVTSTRAAMEHAKHHMMPSKQQEIPEEFNVANFDLSYPSMTSVEGVFAGGDCVDTIYRQASTASGLGVAAGLEAEMWLNEGEE